MAGEVTRETPQERRPQERRAQERRARERRAQDEVRMLALSGGGFLGLFTGVVLDQLEARVDEPLGRRFDLIAGTSIGGVLALALAFEIPMARIVELFVAAGPLVFSENEPPRGAIGRLIDLSRAVLGPKYSGDALRDALQAEFGDATLADALHPVIVPAVDVASSRPKIFKSPRGRAAERDGSLKAVDVAMAACAAPAYFPSVEIEGRLYADGGLFAVAPDQVALHEAEHFDRTPAGRVRMLSIGTAARRYRPRRELDAQSGAVGWLADGRLMLTLISAQQQHVAAMMTDRLGERYLRLDADWPQDARLGIDVATEQAHAELAALAELTVRAAPRTTLSRFLSRPAARVPDGAA